MHRHCFIQRFAHWSQANAKRSVIGVASVRHSLQQMSFSRANFFDFAQENFCAAKIKIINATTQTYCNLFPNWKNHCKNKNILMFICELLLHRRARKCVVVSLIDTYGTNGSRNPIVHASSYFHRMHSLVKQRSSPLLSAISHVLLHQSKVSIGQ